MYGREADRAEVPGGTRACWIIGQARPSGKACPGQIAMLRSGCCSLFAGCGACRLLLIGIETNKARLAESIQ
jgi:hypothetical protein